MQASSSISIPIGAESNSIALSPQNSKESNPSLTGEAFDVGQRVHQVAIEENALPPAQNSTRKTMASLAGGRYILYPQRSSHNNNCGCSCRSFHFCLEFGHLVENFLSCRLSYRIY
jgi:hypothetical protein